MQWRTLWLSVGLGVGVVACRKSIDRQGSSAATAGDPSGSTGAASTIVDRGDDPCIYLAATEAEAYVGPLETPPFRFDESTGAPSEEGDHCMYRGRNGREIMVDVLAGGAKNGVRRDRRRAACDGPHTQGDRASGSGGRAGRDHPTGGGGTLGYGTMVVGDWNAGGGERR